MSASSGEDDNHWPGYVDALTTMTMMLIFIMTILAVTIFGLSQNISRSFVERIARAANIDVESFKATGTQEFAERVVDAIERQPPLGGSPAVAVLPEPSDGRTFQSTALPPSDIPSNVATKRAPALLTLSFNGRATALDEATAKEISEFLSTDNHVAGTEPIELKAYAARAGAVSDARRVAFYRLMTVRQRLIGMGVAASRIKVQIEDRDRAADGETLQIFTKPIG